MTETDVYASLMDRLGHPRTGYLLRVMQKLVTPEEGQQLLDLPAEPGELARRWGMDEEAVNTRLQEFQERGLAVSTRKGVLFDRDIVQLHDSTLASSEEWVDTELLDLWKEFYECEWLQALGNVPPDLSMKYVKVLPAVKAIERSPGISVDDLLPEENIRALIKGADLLSAVPCTCRRSLRRCEAPIHNCLQFNKGAEHSINRRAGPELSVEGATAIANEAEEAGLVHTWPFAVSPNLREICNCCGDCCMLFDPGLRFGTIAQLLEKSRFRALVDRDVCTGCQDCAERCFLGAIEMTQAPPGRKLKAFVDQEKCFGCGVCVVGCEAGALTLNWAQT